MKTRLNMLAVSMGLLATTPLFVHAAAFDRSGQSVAAFFEKGNYAEVSYVAVKPHLPGKETKDYGYATTASDSAQSYGYTSAAIKFEPQKNVRVAILYDEPFGTNYEYTTGLAYNGSRAVIDTQNITTLVGAALVPNLWVYGGMAFQDFQIDAQLSGLSFSAISGYQAKLDDFEVGFVGGVAYEIPDIALRAAVTYRSEIKHEAVGTEVAPPAVAASLPGVPPGFTGSLPVSNREAFLSPQSVNLNLQTGINPTTLLMLDFRWVDFTAVSLSPTVFNRATEGRNALQYQKDAYTTSLGLGKKLTDNLSAVVRLTYDTGTGNNVSIFGPYTDRYTLGVGGKYKFNQHMNASLGVAYSKLGDGQDRALGAVASNFDDNHAIAVAGKLGFYF